MNISILMDARSMATIGKLKDWQPATRYYNAMSDSLAGIENTVTNYMYATFKNPQGDLEGAWQQTITPGKGGIEGALANPLPYAWRRDRGFSGRTDSLGRYFANDPGIEYAEYALDAETPNVLARFLQATHDSLNDLGGI